MNYKLYLTTKLNPETVKAGTGIIVLEPDDYKRDEIYQLRNKGYTVLAYLSIGTIEKERSWYSKYEGCRLGEVENWPNELYADVKRKEWRDFLVARARSLKEKGFSGWWLDNLDVYEYYRSSKMFVACAAVIGQIKKLGGYVMVNGGSEFFDRAIDQEINLSMIDGVTQEEVFSLITSYRGRGKFSKQKKVQREFYEKLLRQLRKKGIDIFLLEYTRSEGLKAEIKKWCKENKASCCIADDVNL